MDHTALIAPEKLDKPFIERLREKFKKFVPDHIWDAALARD